MDIVQIIMLVTAAGVVFMIYKQIDSGNFQQIHKDKMDNAQAPDAAAQEEVVDVEPVQDDPAAQKQQRIEELLEKTDTLVAEGNFKEAKKSIEAALILDENTDNYMRQGYILKNLGEYEEAIASFEQVLSKDDQNDMAYLFLGEIYTIQKDYEKAAQNFESGLKIDNNFEKTHIEYAKMLLDSGNMEKAMQHIDKALQIDPDNADAQRIKGQIGQEV